MRRMFLSVTAVGIVMILLISLIMAFVPDGDTVTTRRYQSGNGFGFDYPRDWLKVSPDGANGEAFSEYGYDIDSVFSRGLLSDTSLTVFISETRAERADIEPMTEELVELYKSYGYEIRKMGYASYGGRVYNEITYAVNGVYVSEYMMSYAGHAFAFVFTKAGEDDVSDILSSVFFSYDTESESA